MKLKLKTGIATILWTAAIACAIVFSVHQDQVVLIWGILTSAAAAVVSAMVAGDYIAHDAAEFIVSRIKAERDATVDRATSDMQKSAKVREDRVVSRVQSANEAALRRVAEEIAMAICSEGPTPFRRN